MTKNLNSANFPWFASRNLWCTDAAKWVPHRVRCCSSRVGATSEGFYFYFILDSCWLGFDSRRFLPNWANLAGIGSYQPAAETGWNWFWMRPKHPKSVLPQFYFEYLLLLLCFLFYFVFLAFFCLCSVNQGHIMCFLRIF